MGLDFIDISHAFGAKPVLEKVTLSAARGEVTCLLGPSGCGKTTLLRLAAGLLDVQHGELRLDGVLLADKRRRPPPEARNVGLVFQEGALFPHLSVARNISFGLEAGQDKDQIINGILSQLGLEGYGGRYPHTLSGGQQQRVALGRAIAPEPSVLLLDEPFANVDVVLRQRLREETRRILKARGAASILVTHDPDEAMEVADKIAVMGNSGVVQEGTPAEIFDNPATVAVGRLFGGGQTLDGEVDDNKIKTAFGKWPLSSLHRPPTDGRFLTLLLRPESLSITADGSGTAVITDTRTMGATQKVLVSAAGGEALWVTVPREPVFSSGELVSVTPQDGKIVAFERRP